MLGVGVRATIPPRSLLSGSEVSWLNVPEPSRVLELMMVVVHFMVVEALGGRDTSGATVQTLQNFTYGFTYLELVWDYALQQ